MLNRIPPTVIYADDVHSNDVLILLDGKQIVPALPGYTLAWESVNSIAGRGNAVVKSTMQKFTRFGKFKIEWNDAYKAKLAEEDGENLYQAFREAYLNQVGSYPRSDWKPAADEIVVGSCNILVTDVDITSAFASVYQSGEAAVALIERAKKDGITLHTDAVKGEPWQPITFTVTRVQRNAPIFMKVNPCPVVGPSSFGFTEANVLDIVNSYNSGPTPWVATFIVQDRADRQHVKHAIRIAQEIEKEYTDIGRAFAETAPKDESAADAIKNFGKAYTAATEDKKAKVPAGLEGVTADGNLFDSHAFVKDNPFYGDWTAGLQYPAGAVCRSKGNYYFMLSAGYWSLMLLKRLGRLSATVDSSNTVLKAKNAEIEIIRSSLLDARFEVGRQKGLVGKLESENEMLRAREKNLLQYRANLRLALGRVVDFCNLSGSAWNALRKGAMDALRDN